MDQGSMSNLNDTQNIIKKKFEKAYMNRLEHEDDVNQAMKPLTAVSASISDDIESKNVSLRDLSKTMNRTSQLRLASKSYSIHASESERNKTTQKNQDPNALCDSLRMQLSSLFAGDMNCMQSINAILEQLRDLDIIE